MLKFKEAGGGGGKEAGGGEVVEVEVEGAEKDKVEEDTMFDEEGADTVGVRGKRAKIDFKVRKSLFFVTVQISTFSRASFSRLSL